jgi:quinone-modifying oxidoreductase subunit QmoB
MISEHSTKTAPNACCDEATPRALIVGGGISAELASKALSETGVQVTFARVRGIPSHLYYCLAHLEGGSLQELQLEPDNVSIVDVSAPPVVRRENGNFRAEFEDGTTSAHDCLFLAPGLSLKPVAANLPEQTELFACSMQILPGQRIAFLMDLDELTPPALGMSAIQVAVANVNGGGEAFVCCRHAPVSHVFGETLYDSARRAGVQFVRFGDDLPEVQVSVNDEGQRSFRLVVTDTIDSQSSLVWDCDRVVQVTGPDVSTIPEWAVKMVNDDLDPHGFILSDGMRSVSGLSLTSGVFVVGEATGKTDLIRCTAQAKAAASAALAWIRQSRVKRVEELVSIGPACARCLTCYRVCPHGALSLNPQTSHSRIEPLSSFCQECGICASVCPSNAVSLGEGVEASVSALIEESQQSEISLLTFVFGCRKSAGLIAQSIRMPDNVRFIAVPCAGSVSQYAIWSTLAAGAKGVLVVGCHHGNCRSDRGTEIAAARVELGTGLGTPGFDPPRIGYFTIAANETARFQRLLNEFLNGDRNT